MSTMFPVDLDDLKARASERGIITGEVVVDIEDLVNGDREDLFDIISEQLTNTIILTDVFYKVIGTNASGQIRLLCEGNIGDIVEHFEAIEAGLI
jgi:hypothetical protein